MVEVKTLEVQTAVGMVYRGPNNSGEIPALWQVFNSRYQELKPNNGNCYGLCYMDTRDGGFAYMAGVTVDQLTAIPEGMETIVIPGGKYAIFTFKDHISKIKDFWQQIYTELLPQAQLVPREAMSFELYDERFQNNGECDIYIPIA